MSEASALTPYSAEYLSLLARKKKLTAKKIGKVWYTTAAILNEYMKRQMIRNQIQNGDFSPLAKEAVATPAASASVVASAPTATPVSAPAVEQEVAAAIDDMIVYSKRPINVSSSAPVANAEKPLEVVTPAVDSVEVATPAVAAELAPATDHPSTKGVRTFHEDLKAYLDTLKNPNPVPAKPTTVKDILGASKPMKSFEKIIPGATPKVVVPEAAAPIAPRVAIVQPKAPVAKTAGPAIPLATKARELSAPTEFHFNAVNKNPVPVAQPVEFERLTAHGIKIENVPAIGDTAKAVAAPANQAVPANFDAIAATLDEISKKLGAIAEADINKIRVIPGQPNIVTRSFRTVFGHRTLVYTTAALVIFFLVFPTPFVFGFFDGAVAKAKQVWNDSNTVMGFRPGTHENEILLLDKQGNISIMGHIQTDGQFQSFAKDGIAPIVVDSRTEVKNLNVEMVGGKKASDFTLAFVTKNGNVTTDDVYLEGSVEVGKTLLVKGATKLLSSLQVDGNLAVFGDAKFNKSLTVAGPAFFEAILNAANIRSTGIASLGEVVTAGNLAVGKNANVHGALTVDGSIVGRRGSFRSLSVSTDFSARGEIALGNPSDTLTINSSNITVDESGNLSLDGAAHVAGNTVIDGNLTVGGTISGSGITFTGTTTVTDLAVTGAAVIQSLVVTNSTTTNATTTNLFANIARIISLAVDSVSVGALTANNSTTTNATTTNSYISNAVITYSTTTNAFVTNLISSTASITDASLTNATIANSTTTYSTTTNAYIQQLINDAATIQSLTGGNATITNATTTSFFSSIASFALGVIDTLVANNATITNSTTSNATTTNSYIALLNADGANFINSTTTNATTTNAFINTATIASLNVTGALSLSSVPNCNTSLSSLKTDGSGTVFCGVVNLNGATSGGGWTSVAPDIVRLSTTTDMVGIGTTSPFAKLSVSSVSTGTTTLALAAAAGQTANILDIFDSSLGLSAVVTSNGFLGLGTTSPSQRLSVQGNALFSGDIRVSGLNFTNATGIAATTTSFFSSVGRFTNGVIDTFTSTIANITSIIANSISVGALTANNSTTTNATSTSLATTNITATGTAALQNLTFLNATGTNATTTNLFATNFNATNVSFGNVLSGSTTVTNLTVTNTSTSTFAGPITVAGGNFTIMQGSGSAGFGTTSPFARLSVAGSTYIGGNLTATGTVQLTSLINGGLAADASGNLYTFSTSTWRFASSTLLTDSNIFTGSNTFSGNTALTNATSTNFFSTTASSTNLFSANASFGNLTVSGNASYLGTGTTTFAGDVLAPGIAAWRYLTSPFIIATSTTATSSIAGSLGIGTTSPTTAALTIDLDNKGTEAAILIRGNQSTHGYIFLQRNDGINQTSGLVIGQQTSVNGMPSLANASVIRSAGGLDESIELQPGINASSLSRGRIDLAPVGGIVRIGANGGTSALLSVGSTSPSVDLLRVDGSAGNSLVFNAVGALGIGTTSPFARFAVQGTSTGATNAFLVANSANATLFNVQNNGNVGIGNTSPLYSLDVTGSIRFSTNLYGYTWADPGGVGFSSIQHGASNKTITFNTNGSARMFLDSTGNVGIGTTTPLAKLSVAGSVLADAFFATSTTATSTFAGSLYIGTTTTNLPAGMSGPLYVAGSVNGGLKTYVENYGAGTGSYVESQLRAYNGAGAVTRLQFGAQPTTYVGSSGLDSASTTYVLADGRMDNLAIGANGNGGSQNNITFYTSGLTASSERMRITNAGNVGVGTTSPFAKLSVQGDGLFSGDIFAANITATGTISTNAFNVTGTATSTFAGDILARGIAAWQYLTAPTISATSTTGTSTFAAGFAVKNNAFVVDATTGKVMIGATSPISNAALTVRGAQIHVDDGGSSSGINFSGGSASAITNQTSGDSIDIKVGTFLGFQTFTGGSYNEKARLANSGNFGLGTTSPFARLSVAGNGYFDGNITASNVSATGTATTTNLTISSLLSSLIKTNALGQVVSAVAGDFWATSSADYYASQFRDWNINSFGALAPTTTRGIFVTASSTVGDGSQVGGLTINGGATTTGNAYFGGNVGIGTAPTAYQLEISGNTTNTARFLGNAGSATVEIGTNGRLQSGGGQYRIYSPGASPLMFGTNGSFNQMTVAVGGNVGIGTTSPFAKLSVQGDGLFSGDIFAANITATGTISTNAFNVTGTATSTFSGDILARGIAAWQYLTAPTISATSTTGTSTFAGGATFAMGGGNVGIGTYSPAQKLQIGDNSAASLGFRIAATGVNYDVTTDTSGNLNFANGGGTFMSFRKNPAATSFLYGNVGIGTTTPSTKLVIDDANPNGLTMARSGTIVGSLLTTTINSTGVLSLDGAVGRPIHIGGSVNTNVILANAGGNVGIGTTTPWATLAVNPTAGVAANQFVVGSSTATNLIVTNAGLVGVGTTIPAAKLDVAGTGASTDFRISRNNNASAFTAIFAPGGSFGNSELMVSGSHVMGLQGTTNGVGIGPTYSTGNIAAPTNGLMVEGNVGIGTSTPGEKLSVVGGAIRVMDSGSGTVIDGSAYLDQDGLKIHHDSATLTTAPTGLGIAINRAAPAVVLKNSIGPALVTEAGNVGIGTTTPATKLQVTADANTSGAIQNSQLAISGATSPTKRLYVGYNTSSNYGVLSAETGSGAYSNIVLNPYGGNVGVGTSTPAAKLDIYGGDQTTNLKVYGNALIGDGSTNTALRIAASPSSVPRIYFNGASVADDQTGIFGNSGSTSNLRFNTSGSVQMTINSSGNVGIGTTTPTAKLNVYSASTPTVVFQDDTAALKFFPSSGVNYIQSGTSLSTSNADLRFTTMNGGTTFLAMQGSTGNIGIGTTNPLTKLDVRSAMWAPQTGYKSVGTFYSTDTLGAGVGAGITLGGVYTGTTVTEFGQVAGIKENATDGNYSGALTFSTRVNGTPAFQERVRIDSTGNVGIGTTSPFAKLSVAGGAYIGGNLTATGTTNLQNLTFTVGTGTSATTTNFFTTNFVATNNIFSNETVTNSTSTNATSTNFFATTASTTNLFASVLNVGSSALVVGSNGNVGVGTTTPGNKLTIAGDATIPSTSGGQLAIVGATNPLQRLLIGYNTTSDYGFIQPVISGSNYQNLILNQHGGNVGIGTTSPSQKLSVQGNALISGDLVATNLTATGTLVVSGTGTSTIAGNGYGPDGIALGNADIIYSPDNFNIYDTSAGISRFGFSANNSYDVRSGAEHRFYVNGSQVAEITSTGRLGLNEALPGTTISTIGGLAVGATTAFSRAAVSNGSAIFEGNVGIGSTTPNTKLTVESSSAEQVITASHTNGNQISTLVGNGGLLATNFFGFQLNGGTVPFTMRTNGDVRIGGTNANSAALLSVLASTGNVGIGTTTPFARLDVAGGYIRASGSTQPVNPVSGKGLELYYDANNDYGVVQAYDRTANSRKDLLVSGENTRIYGGGSEVLRVTSGGNLGIGTTTPGARLDVVVTAGATAKGVAVERFGTQTSGALFAANYLGGTAAIPAAPTTGDTANSLAFYTGGSNASIFSNPSFAIQHRIGGIGAGLSEVNTSFMLNSTANGTPYAAMTFMGQTGNVGIGTTSPTSLFTVQGTGSNYVNISNAGNINITSTNPYVTFDNSFYGSTDYQIYENSIGALNFYNGTDRLSILSGGNVGIGTTTPVDKLDVNGNISLGNGAMRFTTSGGVNYIQSGTAYASGNWTPLYFGPYSSSGGVKMAIDASGNVGIGTTSPTGDLTVNPASGDSAVDILRTSSTNQAYIGMKTSGVPTSPSNLYWSFGLQQNSNNFNIQSYDGSTLSSRLTIENSGDVGIGTSTPGATLAVNGNALINGTLTATNVIATGTMSFGSTTVTNLTVTNTSTSTFGGPVVISNGTGDRSLSVRGTTGDKYLEVQRDNVSAEFLRIIGAAGGTVSGGANNTFLFDAIGPNQSQTRPISWRFSTDSGNTFATAMTLNPLANLTLNYPIIVSTTTATSTFSTGGLTVGSTSFVVQQGSGNVGIGTSNPGLGNTGEAPYLTISSAQSGTTRPGLQLQGLRSGTDGDVAKIYGYNGSNPLGYISFARDTADNSGAITFRTANSGGALTEAVRIDRGGNLGIGTTTPQYKLDVESAIGPQAYFGNGILTGAGASGAIRIGDANITKSQGAGFIFGSGIAPDSDGGRTNGSAVSRWSNVYTLAIDSLSSPLAINTNSSANVGIGTTTPATKLQVTADANTSGAIQNSQLAISGATSPTKRLYVGYNTSSNYGVLSAETGSGAYSNIVLNPYGGNVGIGTTTVGAKLQVDAGFDQLRLVSNSNSQVYDGSVINFVNEAGKRYDLQLGSSGSNTRVGANNFGIYDFTNSAARFVINQSGNVGIGTTTPGTKLEVNGAITGAYQQVLGIRNSGGNIATVATVDNGALALNSGRLNTMKFASSGLNGWEVGTSNAGIAGSLAAGGTVNTLGFYTAGNESMRIDSSGNIGVGTTTPWGQLSINSNGIAGPSFVVGSSTKTSFIVANSGLVGIGTSTPSQKLSVQGDGLFSGNISAANITATGTITMAGLAVNGITRLLNNTFSVMPEGSYSESTTTNVILNNFETNPVSGIGSDSVGHSKANSSDYAIFGSNSLKWTYGSSGSSNVYYNGAPGYASVSTTTFTGTIYVRNADGSPVGTPLMYIYIGGNNGTASTVSTPVGNGWYKVVGTRTVAVAGTVGLSGLTGLSTTQPVYLDGWQIEPGFTSTSYVFGSRSVGDSTIGGMLRVYGSTTLQTMSFINAIGTNSTTTNATSTNFFTTTASSTNLFSSVANIGSNALVVTASGNIGIGTTTPWGQLSVNSNGIAGPSFVVGSSTKTSFIVANSGLVGIGTTNPQETLNLKSSTMGGVRLSFEDGLRTSGNQYGDINFSSASNNSMTFTTYYSGGTPGTGGNAMIFKPGNSEAVRFLQGGMVGIGTTTPWATLAVNPTAGVAANQFVVGSSTKTSFLINNSGNIGIGSTSPWATLSLSSTDSAGVQYAAFANASSSFFRIASSSGFIIDGGVVTPTHKGKIANGAGGASILNPEAVFVRGDYAYIAAGGAAGSTGGDALEIVNIANPASPVHKGSISHGTGGALLASSTSVFVQGNYAYVTASTSNALEIIDISNPTTPAHVGSLSNGVGGALLGAPQAVFVAGGYAYIAASSSNALEIVDITNPAAPVHKGSITNGTGGALLAGPRSVFVQGKYAYVASFVSNAIEVVDVSNPALPVHAGLIANPDGPLLAPTSVFVSGTYAYVTSSGSNALEIIDISNPSAPSHVGSLSNGVGGAFLSNPQSVFVSKNYAYVASAGSNTLEIVDVSNPAAPVHKGYIQNGSGGAALVGAQAVFVAGNNAFVAAGTSNALEVVDVGGLTVANSQIGSAAIDSLLVNNIAQFAQNVSVASALNVGSNAFISGALSVTGTSTFFGPIVASSTMSFGTTTVTNLIVTNTSTSTFAGPIAVGTSQFVVQQGSGRVGVGIANPTQALDVVGTIQASADFRVPAGGSYRSSSGTGGNIAFGSTTAGTATFAFNTNGTGSTVFNGASGNAPFVSLTPGIFQTGTASYTALNINSSESTLGSGVSYLAHFQANSVSRFAVLNTGNVGIGTSTPYAALSVAGATGVVANVYTATSTTATSTFAGGFDVNNGSLRYDFSSGVTSIDNLELGSFAFDTNSGMVSWADMPVTGTAAAGTVESYSAQLDGNPLLTIYAESDGAGGIQKPRVSIGTTTPYSRFQVWGTGTGASSMFALVNNASTTVMTALENGNVGIGTTNPSDVLTVNGTTTIGALGLISVGDAVNNFNTFTTNADASLIIGSNLTFKGSNTNKNVLINARTHGTIGGAGIVIGGNTTGINGVLTDDIGLFTTGAGSVTGGANYAASIPSLIVKASGNVGIGTTTPSTKLEIKEGILTLFANTVTQPASTAVHGLSIGFDANTEHGWIQSIRNNTSETRVLELNPLGGNVGIGTTTPSQSLSVQGNGLLSGNLSAANITATGTISNGPSYLTNAGVLVVQGPLGNNNSVTIAGQGGAGTNPLIQFTPTASRSYIGYGTSGGAGMLRITNTGHFTIGSETDTGHTLQINGDSYFTATTSIATTTGWGLLSVNPNGISGPSFVIGSSTKTDFVVTNGGDVGIGTTSPGRKFSAQFSSNSANQGALFETTVPSNYPTLVIQNLNGGGNLMNDQGLVVNNPNGSGTSLNLNSRSMYFQAGKLALGGTGMTSAPLAALQISGVGGNAQAIMMTHDNVGNYRNSITNQWDAGTLANNKMSFLVSDTSTSGQNTVMTLTGNGNVGIGTTTPDAKVSILGGTTDFTSQTTLRNSASLALDAAGNAKNALIFRGATGNGDFYIGADRVGGSQYMTLGYMSGSTNNQWVNINQNTGNVGIGTTSPLQKLDVVGNATFGAGTTGAEKVFISNSAIGFNRNTTVTTPLYNPNVQGFQFTHFGSATAANDYLQLSSFSGATGGSLGSNFFAMNAATGNIGIGTTGPLGKLQIGSVTSGTGEPTYHGDLIIQGQTATASANGGIEFKTNSNSSGHGWRLLPLDDANDTFLIQQRAGTAVWSSLMSILYNGNVGIGTTTPASLLSVGNNTSEMFANSSTVGIVERSTDTVGLSIRAPLNNPLMQFCGNGNCNYIGMSTTTGALLIGSNGSTASNDAAAKMTLSAAGNVRFNTYGAGTLTTDASGNITAASDERLKDISGGFNRGLSAIQSLNPIVYRWNATSTFDTGTDYAGFSAQNVQAAIPEAVGMDTHGYLTLQDRPILAAVVNAVKNIDQVVSVSEAPTTTPALKVTSTGDIGIGTTTPAYKLHVLGDVAAQSFVNVSTRASKKEISYLDDNQKTSILSKLKNIGVATYRYNSEDESDALHLGLIAEEAPIEVLATGGKGVDVYKMSTFILAGVQEMAKKLDAIDAQLAQNTSDIATLKDTVASLQSTIASLSANATATAATGTTTASTTIVWSSDLGTQIMAFLEAAGIKFQEGIAYIKNAVVETLSANIAYIKDAAIDSASVGALTVGTAEKRSGITLYDQLTGEPYCLKIAGGQTVTTPGQCPLAATSTPAVSQPVPGVSGSYVDPNSPSNSNGASGSTEPTQPVATTPVSTVDQNGNATSTDPMTATTTPDGAPTQTVDTGNGQDAVSTTTPDVVVIDSGSTSTASSTNP